MIKKITLALVVALAALLAGCGASSTSCTNGVCVTTPKDGVEWPEPAPEPTGLAKKPKPVLTPKKKPVVTAIPPGAPVNPSPTKTDRARRVEFHMKRTEQSGASVEIEWMINGQHMLPLPTVTTGGWRHVEWLKPGSTVHLWISRNPGNTTRIKCWITVNGRVPDPSNRPDGVPMFQAAGDSRSPFDCYVSAYVT